MNTRIQFGLVVAVLLLAVPPTRAQKTCKIAGQVLDGNDNGIGRVEIKLYRDMTQVGSGQSDPSTGDYSVGCTSGSTITKVRYDHSDWVPGKLENISGKNSHNVYKTLLPGNKSFTPLEAQEIIATLEEFYELDKANNTLSKNARQYVALLQKLEELQLSAQLRDRARIMKTKYGAQ